MFDRAPFRPIWPARWAAAAALWFASLAAAGEQQAAQVVLERCNIKLIDHVTLSFDRAGVLEFVVSSEGVQVDQDEVVASLKGERQRIDLKIAELRAANDIDVRYARKAAEVAETEYQKFLQVNEQIPDTVSEIEIQRLKLTAERAVLQMEQAKHEMELNRLDRDRARAEIAALQIKAPFAGVVTRRFKSAGEAVRQGEPIVELTGTSRLRVEGLANLQDAVQIRPGAPVTVQVDLSAVDLPLEKEQFTGHVIFVDPTVQPVTGQVRVLADVTNRNELLKAGLTARMTIHLAAEQ